MPITPDIETVRNRDLYDGIGKTFQGYFILSAVILSLIVLCAGSLYSAVNSLDFVKLIADDFGYSPVRWEFVYLYGALYTLILLIIYVPAHMRMKDIKIGEELPKTSGSSWWDFGKSLGNDLKSILVAVSPLLTGLLQSFFDFLFN